MSLESITRTTAQPVYSGPSLVADNVVDLSPLRKQHAQENSLDKESECSDNICVLSWKPRKPDEVA